MEHPTTTKQMSSPSNSSKGTGRTYKRETAWFLFAVWFSVVGYSLYDGSTEVLAIITPPVFLFAGAAFSMDWAAKQTDLTQKREQ